MRLIYLASIRLPTERAHGLQIMKTCDALARHGVDVTLVIPGDNRGGQKSTEEIFYFYGIKNTFKIQKSWVPPFQRLGNLGMYLQSMWFMFFAPVPHLFAKNVVLYARQPANLIIPAILGKKAIFESHEGRYNLPVRLILGLGARILTITRASKEMYEKRGIKASRIGVIPDSVDLGIFAKAPSYEEARRRLDISSDTKIAMYTGSFGLFSWKGTDVFLDASNLLRSVRFYAVGGTKSEIETFKTEGRYPNVVFMEKIAPGEIPAILAAADVLVIPNKAGNEISELHTSPMKLFEYMASARPIVASGVRSILEIVDENSAVIVKPNDPKALADAVDKVLADKAYATRISSRSKELSRLYTWDARAKLITGFIRDFYVK